MNHRFVLAAAAILLVIITPCSVWIPRPSPAQSGAGQPVCPVPTPVPGASMHWYDGSDLVYVAPGEFTMGIDRGADNPSHRVLLDGFWINKTEVTNAMYGACVASGACTAPGPAADLPDYTDPSLKDSPVVGVNWAQADTYCKWVGGTLPTEAQWEKAARGPDGTYPWGATPPDCDRINFNNCVGQLSSVIAYPAGATLGGALDFSGNAYEWVSDWYKASYYLESPRENPPGPASGENRALRGGSFESSADQVLPTVRYSDMPTASRPDLGFRCVVMNAELYAQACQVASSIGSPYSYVPRQGGAEQTGCVPPPVDPRVETYCVKKVPYANISPNGAMISFQEGQKCSQQGDVYVCTGDASESFSLKACSSCTPPESPAPAVAAPSCPAGYQLDDAKCACRYVGTQTCAPASCPSTGFALLVVPTQQCCQSQAASSGKEWAKPKCATGYVPYNCSCIGKVPGPTEPITKCEIVNVTLPPCSGANPGGGCQPRACPQPQVWDPGQCCCARSGSCQ